MNDDGIYEKVSWDYAFDIIYERPFRITGLAENEKYTFRVYSDVYINNASGFTDVAEKNYTVYSAYNYGVAIGNEVVFSVTAKSFVATFYGGSNFSNVTEVGYTIYIKDGPLYATDTIPIVEGKSGFVIDSSSSNWKFVIPSPKDNQPNDVFDISISLKIMINSTDYVVLNQKDISSLQGVAVYEDDN